ncbi:MAG TPA: TetR/AcrR family transcriptional regulator [Acidimicrobiales bacterium]|nr:TetR/AcrR family transcriptional regulator [Acidimicrobiales bacterium]
MTQTAPARGYHHGDLPNALKSAALEVIDEKGLGGFSLREVARRAGVSHAAPAHHFGDTAGLLTVLAVDALGHMRRVMAEAAEAETDPVERLAAVGRAYVRVSREHPGHCQVVFRTDLVDTDDPALVAAGLATFEVVRGVVADLAAEMNPDLDIDTATRLCWSTMQGVVEIEQKMKLHAHHSGTGLSDTDDTISAFTRMLVEGLRAR